MTVRPATAGTIAVTVGFPETIVVAPASEPDLPPSEDPWVTVTERAPVAAEFETVAVALIVVESVTDTEVNDTPVPDAEPTAVPEPTATSAEAVSPLPTPTEEPAPTPTSEPEPVDWSDTESSTAEGYYELGNPDAPMLILDYSDFL